MVQITKQSFKTLRNRIKELGVVFLLILSFASGFVGGILGAKSREAPSTQTSRQIITSEGELISDIAKKVGPSVVSVSVISHSVRTNSLFGFSQPIQQESAGTGVILSDDGVVMTNRHVVPAGTSDVAITLSDGTRLDDVEVIGRTNATDSLDVAFLKIKDKKGKTISPAQIGDSSKVQVGDRVVAIGNALGQFQNTVTSGIISGYGRNIEAGDESSSETLQNVFQTDAAINQGNSGGPLVNANEEVIGLNTAIAGGAQNIGFAIPINDLKGLIKSVLNDGKLERPFLGVRYISLTDDVAAQLNLSVKRGAYIGGSDTQAAVVGGSPAEKAGLKEKDIITKVNETAIDENNSLTSILGRFSVGDNVTLTILRDGKEQKIPVKLEAAPTS